MGSIFNGFGMEVKVVQTNKQWYVVHAFSGMEKTVLKNLEERIKQAGMADLFGRILVPVEEVVEIRKVKSLFRKEGFSWLRFSRNGDERANLALSKEY